MPQSSSESDCADTALLSLDLLSQCHSTSTCCFHHRDCTACGNDSFCLSCRYFITSRSPTSCPLDGLKSESPGMGILSVTMFPSLSGICSPLTTGHSPARWRTHQMLVAQLVKCDSELCRKVSRQEPPPRGHVNLASRGIGRSSSTFGKMYRRKGL